MIKKTNMCILFRDEVVDAVFIDHSVLGVQIKFMERLQRNEQVFEAVAALMNSVEKTPSRVTLCIPRDATIQRTLNYPAAAKSELNNMIQFEATRHVPLPEADRLLGWSAVDTPDEKQVVLNLVAARRSEVRELIERFEQAGVPIDEAVPFSSAVSPVLATTSTLLVLADAGHLELCLYGLGSLQDSQLISRNMPGFSPERVVAAARQMAAKHKTWLGDEGIGQVLVAGADSLQGDLEEELGSAFGLHTHPLKVPSSLESVATERAEALVEVLLAASVAFEPTLNLIEDKKRKVPISKRNMIIYGLCILLGGELLAAYALKTGSPWLQRKKVAKETQEMRRSTAEIQAMRDRNRVFRKQLYQLEQVCETRTSMMEMLRTISEALPEDTYLRTFAGGGEELTLRGFSKEPDRLPELIMAIPFVDTLSTSEIGKKEGDYYEFTLSVSLRR